MENKDLTPTVPKVLADAWQVAWNPLPLNNGWMINPSIITNPSITIVTVSISGNNGDHQQKWGIPTNPIPFWLKHVQHDQRRAALIKSWRTSCWHTEKRHDKIPPAVRWSFLLGIGLFQSWSFLLVFGGLSLECQCAKPQKRIWPSTPNLLVYLVWSWYTWRVECNSNSTPSNCHRKSSTVPQRSQKLAW